MKRLFKNDGTLLFGYWIHTNHNEVPESYHLWACERVPDYDYQLERLRRGLAPLPGIKDGTKALPVMSPPVRKTFVSKQVRPMNHSPATPPPVPPSNVQFNLLDQAIEKAIKEGLSRRQIADLVGLSKGGLDARIKKLGLPKPRDGRKDNKVSPEIASMGRDALKARSALRKKNHKQEPSLVWNHALLERLDALRERGLSWNEVANAIDFGGGGHVLCTRYAAYTTYQRRKALVEATTTPPPRKRNLLQRIWDAFFPSDCM